MLDDFFTEYLNKVFSPDYAAMINSCRQTLIDQGYTSCEADLYKAMPETADVDVLSSKMLFEQCLRDGFNEFFLQIGIRSKIVKLSDMEQLLRAVANLEGSLCHEDILSVIGNEYYSLDETLEHLFALVVIDPQFSQVMFEFELSDSSNFINRLYDIHKAAYTSSKAEEPAKRLKDDYIARVKEFTDKYPDSLLSKRILNKQILPGKKFDHYIQENEAELLAHYPTGHDKPPIDFMGLAIYANIQRFELSGHVKTAITKFYGDLRYTTKTNFLVDKVIEELEYGKLQ